MFSTYRTEIAAAKLSEILQRNFEHHHLDATKFLFSLQSRCVAKNDVSKALRVCWEPTNSNLCSSLSSSFKSSLSIEPRQRSMKLFNKIQFLVLNDSPFFYEIFPSIPDPLQLKMLSYSETTMKGYKKLEKDSNFTFLSAATVNIREVRS